jgi:hypothetical protein
MAKGKLNIFRDSFLEKEELDRLVSFINDNPALFLFVSSTDTFGIIQQGISTSLDPAFKIEFGTNANTVKMVTDSYALDSASKIIYQRAFDNLVTPTDGRYYWMKISHRYDNYEQGFVNIAIDGTLSGSGTSFTDVLRGNSSGFPTKVKFYKQAADGSLSAANNSGIYEVVSVAGATTAVISGSFSAETNLRYVVLGAFSIKTSLAAITSTGIYSYDSCNIEFVEEEWSEEPPTTGFTEGLDFYIARIYNDGVGDFTIDTTVRSDYYFRLNFGDIVVNDKASTDAGNLTAPDIVAWLVKLAIYTSAQVDTLLTAYLAKAQNLNDLANKTTARTNLGVYSTTYIDGFGTRLTRKIIEIGDWNIYSTIDGTVTKTVAHGVTAANIRQISAIVRNDDASLYHSFPEGIALLQYTTTDVYLTAPTGSIYDSTDYNATSYNRGWIVIDSIPA